MPTVLEDYFEFLEPYGIRIKGHRINLEHVIRLYTEGRSAEQIAEYYPGLSLEKIYVALAYYWAHKEEVEAYIRRGEEDDEQAYQEWLQQPDPLRDRIRAIKEQRGLYEP
jgi:uncharacterized protein (DUF433 family)